MMAASRGTVDVYRYKIIESTRKNFVTLVLKFFHIDSIGITYKYTRKKLEYMCFHIVSIGTLQQCGDMIMLAYIGTWPSVLFWSSP